MANKWAKFTGTVFTVAIIGLLAIFFAVKKGITIDDVKTKTGEATAKVGKIINSEKALATLTAFKQKASKSIKEISDSLEEEEEESREITPTKETSVAQKTPEKENKNTGARWGVVKSTGANAYNTSFSYLRKIPAGAILEVLAVKKIQSEELALCNVEQKGEMVNHIFFRAKNLIILPGSLSKVSSKEKELRSRQSIIAGQMREHNKNMASANPHLKEYTKAREEYVTFWKKVKELEEKRNSSTKGDHVKHEDQLRMMKGEDVRLGQKYNETKKKYEEWNAKNSSKYKSDSKMESLRTELAQIQRQLKSF